MGLDLSLRASGMAVIPTSWGLDWSCVDVYTYGYELETTATVEEQLDRLNDISKEVLAFAEEHSVTHVFVEEYAFSRVAARAFSIGELGGVVKLDLMRQGLIPAVVNATSARSVIGKFAGKGQKNKCRAELTTMGCPRSWTEDEVDAFVAANWGLSELGGSGILVERA